MYDSYAHQKLQCKVSSVLYKSEDVRNSRRYNVTQGFTVEKKIKQFNIVTSIILRIRIAISYFDSIVPITNG